MICLEGFEGYLKIIFAKTLTFPLKKIVFTITNDITYDQRMQRICSSLAANNFDVLLVGRKLQSSSPVPTFNFKTKRLNCFAEKGFSFYAEYNLRLFFFLLFCKADAFCAIDLDTIFPVWLCSLLRNKKRVYDAHELFTEQKEIVTRPAIHKIWLAIEKFCVPKFKQGYTVNIFIKKELKRRYGVEYGIIRNMPLLLENAALKMENYSSTEKFIVYQGAVNEGRSFETLIPAMQMVNCKLLICGKGNFFEQTKALITKYNLEQKIEMRGYVSPQALKQLTPTAYIGLTLFEKTGLNQYYSLSNRFFDYTMAGIPQVCVGYPEYKAINDEHNIAFLIDDVEISTIANAINCLLNDEVLYNNLKTNTVKARNILCWQNEEKKLVEMWNGLWV